MEERTPAARDLPDGSERGIPDDAFFRLIRTDRVVRLATAAGLAWLLFYAIASDVTRHDPIASRFIANVVYQGPITAATLTSALAAYRRRGRTRTGRAWGLFAASSGCWLLGELIWAYYAFQTDSEVPYPSAADGCYIIGYLLMLPAFVLAFGQGHRTQRVRAMIDLLLVTFGIGSLGWQLLVKPQLTGHGLELVFSALYPLADIAIVISLLTLGLSGHRRLPASVRLVGWSYVFTVATDALAAWEKVHGGYEDSSWSNVGYQLCSLVFALAGLVAARREEPDAVRLAVGRDLTVVPLVLSGMAAAVVVATDQGKSSDALALAGLLAAGLIVRQYLVTRERTHLAKQLGRALREQERLAVTDPLTDLYNRRFFQETLELEAARARRSGEPVSLVVLDLDHFKRINDERGHAAGDAALIESAARMRAAIRTGDLVARQGGEEFVWLLPDTDEVTAVGLAERLRLALSETPVEMPGSEPIRITGSLGVATAIGNIDTAALVRDADRAMYKAKASGRDRVMLADGSDEPLPTTSAGRETGPAWLADRLDAAAGRPGRSERLADQCRRLAVDQGLSQADAELVAAAGRLAVLRSLVGDDRVLLTELAEDEDVVVLLEALEGEAPPELSDLVAVLAECLDQTATPALAL